MARWPQGLHTASNSVNCWPSLESIDCWWIGSPYHQVSAHGQPLSSPESWACGITILRAQKLKETSYKMLKRGQDKLLDVVGASKIIQADSGLSGKPILFTSQPPKACTNSRRTPYRWRCQMTCNSKRLGHQPTNPSAAKTLRSSFQISCSWCSYLPWRV